MEIIEMTVENEILTVIYHQLNDFNEWGEKTISIEDGDLEKFIRRKSKSDESYTNVLQFSLNHDLHLVHDTPFFDIDLFMEYDYKREVLEDYIKQY
jgi:hypothetical protein